MPEVGGIGGAESILFFMNGLKGFFPSPLIFLRSINSFVICFSTLYMLAMSVGYLSLFSVSVLRIFLFFVIFFDEDGLFSSLPWELVIDAMSFSTYKASMKFPSRVLFLSSFYKHGNGWWQGCGI